MVGTSFTYFVTLLLITGGLVLFFDRRTYRKNNMKKEVAFARVLGWGNILVGVVLYVGNWVYQNYFWW
ncbi:CLC_0170 family protein [Alteribacillus iranensis]|uniref:Uncharacterized protein n=1 Tax=Alteribacillus iranensis TaxID=930128 RepID=A0A1I2DJD4_9BACI|nr:CLC_0170 family protein [Alteribacillus iranensis]SFE80752.1 hypothetical protein SAMN05192532_104118 [Alteribacillus iranensis]